MKGIYINTKEQKINQITLTPSMKDIILMLDYNTFNIEDYDKDNKLISDYLGCTVLDRQWYFTCSNKTYGGSAMIVNNDFIIAKADVGVTVSLQEVIDKIKFLPQTHREIKQFDFNL
jgi:hypothetical protein